MEYKYTTYHLPCYRKSHGDRQISYITIIKNSLRIMIIHLPTGKQFANRKEAKIYFGTAYYYKLEREKRDLLFTDNVQSATNEYCQATSNKRDKQNKW